MKQFSNLAILSIDTSCDDTCIAIIKGKGQRAKGKGLEILSNIVSSQVKIHQKYGGVYPTLAKREHQKNLVPTLKLALKQANMLKISNSQFLISKQIPNSKFQILNSILEREPELLKKTLPFLKKYQKPKIDAIAITIGPGLELCLWVGVNFVRSLGYVWNLPIVPVNHIEAHILANFVGEKSKVKSQKSKVLFPAVCLVVSGGHTQLILMRDFGKYKILGETRDDAAGECFDKTARILGLGYPGGPAIAAEATSYKIQDTKYKIQLPRPMLNTKDYDFSFSGLKTAVLYNFRSQPKKIQKDKNYIKTIAAEIQQAIIDVLIKKTTKAAKNYKAKTIMLGGGVTSNTELRKQFKEKIKKELPNIQYLIPNIQFCTDNAVMVGITGYFRWKKMGKSENWQDIKADANLRIK